MFNNRKRALRLLVVMDKNSADAGDYILHLPNSYSGGKDGK